MLFAIRILVQYFPIISRRMHFSNTLAWFRSFFSCGFFFLFSSLVRFCFHCGSVCEYFSLSLFEPVSKTFSLLNVCELRAYTFFISVDSQPIFVFYSLSLFSEIVYFSVCVFLCLFLSINSPILVHANFWNPNHINVSIAFPFYSFHLDIILCVCACTRALINSLLQNILLVKAENERLGMHIKGGLNGQRGNPLDPADEGVFVSKINSSGAARRDGRLKVC